MLTPTGGVDPRSALATSMHAAPGIYAILAGSGLSSAAGVRTGWQVVQDLVRRIALADGVNLVELQQSPEDWWIETRGVEPRYDDLLAALAPTDAGRQSLLRGYFDPSPTEGGPIGPTDAHRALAALCARGAIRVILTTNFDRLIERALEDAGAAPQVVSGPDALNGMVPIVHAPTTLVKLHGDYLTLGMRNTPKELASYPQQVRQLLARVLDEFGLIVIGWSAEYDTDLVASILAAPGRRYPSYWAKFNADLTETARRVVAHRQGVLLDTAGADELLTDIRSRVERLDFIAKQRRKPRVLRTYAFPPEQSSVPPGWGVAPLLHLRCAAAVSPASVDTCGFIGPHDRTAMTEALRAAPVTAYLQAIGASPAASAAAVPSPDPDAGPASPMIWDATPGGHQTSDLASYRLGGDASNGVSALLSVQLPAVAHGSWVVFILDIAVSLQQRLRLGDIARLWRDALVLTSASLPDALAGVVPPGADAIHGELHALAMPTDGLQHNRPNTLEQRIDFLPLGPPTRSLPASIGSASQLVGGLTDHQAAEVVLESFELMALNSGFLDPSAGLEALRHELGVPSGYTAIAAAKRGQRRDPVLDGSFGEKGGRA